MSKKKYGFIISQTGAPTCVRNLNDDYSFKVKVMVQTDADAYMESVRWVSHIYYNSAYGWVPVKHNETHCTWEEVLEYKSEEDANLLSQMAQALGEKAISQMFYTAECIWKAAPQNNTITNEDIL